MLSVAQSAIAVKWTYLTGQGHHMEDVPPLTLDEMILSAKLNFAQGLIYNPILGCVKFAIILFLLRLDDKRRRIQWTLWGLFAFNAGHIIAVFLVVVFQCTPVHMYWDHFKTDVILDDGTVVNPNYHCIDQAAFSISTAGVAVATDVVILMVPVFIMWNLRMPLRRKLAVLFVLSLGWVVAVVGAVRIKFFVDMWYGSFKDPSHSLWSTLSAVENNVAIMVASGPAIKALITWFSPRFFGTSFMSKNTGNVQYAAKSYELNSRDRVKGMARTTERSRREDEYGDTGSQEAIVKSVSVEVKDGAATDLDDRRMGSGIYGRGWGDDTRVDQPRSPGIGNHGRLQRNFSRQ